MMNDFSRIQTRFSTIQIIPYDPIYCDQVIEIIREIHAESIYRNFPISIEKTIQQLSSAFDVASDHYFKIAVRKGVVFGGFFGQVLRVFFCDELIAKDKGWWVKKNHRGGAAAILLLNDFEVWAKEKGAKMIGIGQSGVENIDITGKLFLHCGYRFTGFNTAKEI